ncbi:MAG TPA: hypothetical protein PK513_01950 [Alphaproteobacteria bacterium]|nr:hypothetical protein [Alphaproteobacteria bacterium]USO04736.1 MAG: hypothetical protein H6859_06085 [Rhodospirillales bacterium]HOO81247.1 hypothetical protein [Alphaproteobacteria bacterium]
MKRRLVIAGIVLAVLVAGAFIYDAVTAKPQREILIDKDYRPAPPKTYAPVDETLTPMPK